MWRTVAHCLRIPHRFQATGHGVRLYSDDFVKKNEPQSLVLPYDSQMAAETTCPPLAKPLKLEHDNPITRSLNAFGIKGSGASDPKYEQRVGFPRRCDVLIVGGGAIGCSVAYWLKKRSATALEVVVVERDPAYTRASTVLSVGGLRQQFSLRENIELSLYGAEFLRKCPSLLEIDGRAGPDVQFHPHGYLFLATQNGAQQLKENFKLQREVGAKLELMTAKRLKEKFPWINTDGLELACLGLENEGWFDPWALLMGLRNKALSMGVTFVRGEAVGFETTDRSIMRGDSPDVYRRASKVQVRLGDGEHRVIEFSQCVVSAGPQSGHVARLLGIGAGTGLMHFPLPVEPRKRYVYCFHAPEGPGLDCPLTCDPSGSYFRREGLGGHYLAGKSPAAHEEPGVENLDVDYTFFDQHVWPDIAKRVPAFENIKLKSAWAGYYDYNTLDQNAIVGPHPYHGNVIFATGFSGHGIQQAPAIGRAVMELMIDGQFVTIDLQRFGFQRVVHNEPVAELNIV